MIHAWMSNVSVSATFVAAFAKMVYQKLLLFLYEIFNWQSNLIVLYNIILYSNLYSITKLISLVLRYGLT